MAARSGSLAWVVLAGAISIIIAGAMWGLLDAKFVDSVTATQVWGASNAPVVSTGRAYVIATWNWFLLLPVLRLAVDALVASRLRGSTTNIPAATFVLLIVHVMFVLWMLTFPEMGQPLYERATNSSAVSSAGYDTGVNLAWQWGVGVIPAVMVLIADVWYLSAPIRNDLLRT